MLNLILSVSEQCHCTLLKKNTQSHNYIEQEEILFSHVGHIRGSTDMKTTFSVKLTKIYLEAKESIHTLNACSLFIFHRSGMKFYIIHTNSR